MSFRYIYRTFYLECSYTKRGCDGQIMTQMVVHLPIVHQFRLMKYSLIHKSVPLQHLLRPLIMWITRGGNKAESEPVETIVQHRPYRFRHIAFSPMCLVEYLNAPRDSPVSGRE